MMTDIIKQIEEVDEFTISEVVRAVVRRFHALNPAFEGLFLAVPTDSAVRNTELKKIFDSIRATYKKQDAER